MPANIPEPYKPKELTSRELTSRRTMADIQDEIEEACGHMIRLRLCYRGEDDE